MKYTSHLLLTLIILITFWGCNKIGNTDNPLYGKIYEDVSELPGFTGCQQVSGFVIESSRSEDGNYKLGFTYFKHKGRYILMFEEILKPNEKGDVSYKILDTITVLAISEDQFITHACSQGDENNDKVIALVTAKDAAEGEYKVIKAWLIDSEKGRIILLEDTKGITCFMEDFDGCGEDDYEEVVEDSLISDTTVQAKSIDKAITQPIDSVASE